MMRTMNEVQYLIQTMCRGHRALEDRVDQRWRYTFRALDGQGREAEDERADHD